MTHKIMHWSGAKATFHNIHTQSHSIRHGGQDPNMVF